LEKNLENFLENPKKIEKIKFSRNYWSFARNFPLFSKKITKKWKILRKTSIIPGKFNFLDFPGVFQEISQKMDLLKIMGKFRKIFLLRKFGGKLNRNFFC
jgi:hypothetical protein